MSLGAPRPRDGERGFTLAAVLVILSILMVFVAYTVPQQWSLIMQREREYQTIFVMEQYAAAISEFNKRNGGLPTSLDQLEEFNNPRVLRQRWPNPLSGEEDWILVPPGTQPGGAPQPDEGQPGQPLETTNPGLSGSSEHTGPFVGVRPPQSGESIVEYDGASSYEDWLITTETIAARNLPQGQNPQPNPNPNP
ncbi:MAG: type II secretion system GspH family protein [Acidobacteria bacterium]|nr:type II secretion system GspH family protein [Acidobacteriota bacterium]